MTTSRCHKSQWLASGAWRCRSWFLLDFVCEESVEISEDGSDKRSGHGGDGDGDDNAPACRQVAFRTATLLVVTRGLPLSIFGSSEGNLFFRREPL